jgi:YHS domain-containing protein
MAALKQNENIMKIRTTLIAVLAVILGWSIPALAQTSDSPTNTAILYYTCPMHPSVKSDKPGSCPYCGMSLEPVYGSANANATTNAPSLGTNSVAAAAIKPKPYPFKTCLVDGMKLGSMGDPYVFVYQGQEIKLCCPACKPVFLKDPKKYLKKIKDAESKK